jgi:hypothetical protein
MRHGTYIGKDKRLRGKTALVRDDPMTEGMLAQFDDVYLPEAFDWWPFRADEFELDELIDWTEEAIQD